MTDSEFVLWYINKHYLFTGTKFKQKYLINEDSLTFSRLYRNVSDSIAIYKVEDKPLYDFLNNWYIDKINSAKLDIFDYLKFKYKVILGPTNWSIAKMSGQIINVNEIINELSKKNYDKEFLSEILEEWFDNEMIRITETGNLMFK